jgi:hypothetical protein
MIDMINVIKKKFLNDEMVGKLTKTFVEGYVGALVVTLPTITDLSDIKLLESAFVGAVAMGLSAVLNYIQSLLNKDKEC